MFPEAFWPFLDCFATAPCLDYLTSSDMNIFHLICCLFPQHMSLLLSSGMEAHASDQLDGKLYIDFSDFISREAFYSFSLRRPVASWLGGWPGGHDIAH